MEICYPQPVSSQQEYLLYSDIKKELIAMQEQNPSNAVTAKIYSTLNIIDLKVVGILSEQSAEDYYK